jgi:hypothetical protein
MVSTLIGVALVALAVASVVMRLRARRGARPRTASAGLVRVPGQVVSQHRLTLRWTIRYPLPDGTPHEFLVERTLPEKLSEGMAVPVLVDPADPHRARLDVPERDRVVSGVVIGVAATFVVVLLVVGGFAAFLFSLG